MRIQCISRPCSTCSLPTTGTLFSAWQATTQALHPVQVFSGAVTELHPQLVAAAGDKDVWVVGGGDVAAQFIAVGLVDEMIVSYAPCSLGSGAPVLPLRSEWTLAETGVNGDFVCARWKVRR